MAVLYNNGTSIKTAILVVGSIYIGIVDGSATKPTALFVFGDSYADTGNHNASDPELCAPWKWPYGRTWPRYPSGRFSDGWVFSDFYASFLGVQRPLPYQLVIKHAAMEHLHLRQFKHRQGINFAFGGSGVFPTFGLKYPNISAQMGQLRELMDIGLVSIEFVRASTALLVVAGNDYSAYENLHGGDRGISEFIPLVVEQIVESMETLHQMGFKIIRATNLAPLGCLPRLTRSTNYTSCNDTINLLSLLHNEVLSSNVNSLQSKLPSAQFLLLDLHEAFQTVISGGNYPLRPCCEGKDQGSCGDIDENGNLLYNLCGSSNETMFWDNVHPSDEGWTSISRALFSSLEFSNKPLL